MIKIKTDRELLTETRNEVMKRSIGHLADAAYFKVGIKKAKTNTQEAVDARNNFATSERQARLDRDYVKIIDEMLTGKMADEITND